VLENLYVGLYFDWDVGLTGGQVQSNEGSMNRSYDLGYMYSEESADLPYVGSSVLTEPGMTAYQVIANLDESYGFTRAEFYETLSGGFQDTLRTDADYSFVIGTGPLTLAPGDTIETAFAMLAGEDLEDLLVNVDAARVKWLEIEASGVGGQGGDGAGALPRAFSLSQNYPNPFNPATTIAFTVPGNESEAVPTLLTIYNMRGQRVATLLDRAMKPGTHSVTWDGKNEAGVRVSSGVYLYTLQAGSERTSKKMVILK
jgi:hypothetical protein